MAGLPGGPRRLRHTCDDRFPEHDDMIHLHTRLTGAAAQDTSGRQGPYVQVVDEVNVCEGGRDEEQ
jgi:hypothetical protein